MEAESPEEFPGVPHANPFSFRFPVRKESLVVLELHVRYYRLGDFLLSFLRTEEVGN